MALIKQKQTNDNMFVDIPNQHDNGFLPDETQGCMWSCNRRMNELVQYRL